MGTLSATKPVAPTEAPESRKKPSNLWVQVLLAIAVALALGYFSPSKAIAMKPLGDAFIRLITMIVTLIIFCTVVTGIAGMEDMKKVGRVGGKALLYFEAVSTLALLIGLVVGNVVHTGSGFNVNPATLDSKAVVPLLEKAQSAKIPVVGFDSGVDSNIPVTTAATDNIAAAGAAADKMAQMIGDEGEVGVIVHDQTSRTGIDRRDGFVNQMKTKHSKVNIVDIQYGGGDQLKSTDLAKAMMQAHPNLKGFFGANEGSIIGVLNAVKELNKSGKLVVIGYDSGKQQTDAIRGGVEAGAITQDPIGIGYKCVDSAVKAIKGESLPKNIDTGFYWYDKTNIDDPKVKAVLYD